jgi:hypothetical protein
VSWQIRIPFRDWSYLIPKGGAAKRADGVREIHRLDVFEVTATPTPMNNGTRVLSTKAVEDDDNPDRVPTQAELERELIRLGIITAPTTADQYRQADPVLTGQGPNGHGETKSHDRIRTEERDRMCALLTAADAEAGEKSIPTKSVQIATFEC